MERRNSLNGRYSLSMSNLSGIPMAESTHISHNQKKFSWGDSALNSSEKYNRNDLFNKTTIISKAGLRQKHDPRTYTDIQSKGLTSRIVKYHGNNSRLNSSLSMNNLYNKPGQFPVVHLRKKEISCNLNKKNFSMVRIAPPEKSVFQANTRSSILRTGSIVSTVGIKKSGNELSRENRPILHPAVENEIAPTRSVLDDLKEISRKRINSDVLDGSDSLKKYCKEPELSPSMHTLQQTSISTSMYPVITSKRQRELPLSTVDAQKSPEQLGIKRRMYSNSNNDITSSLSSSLSILSPKKIPTINTKITGPDLYLAPQKLNLTPSSLKSKSTFNLGHNTPLTLTTTLPNEKCNGEAIRSYSEPVLSIQTNKPKLTLFNKNYETVVSKESIQNQKKNMIEEGSGICFVKPKANTLDSNNIGLSKNSLILKAQKSKLALMLSGLSGEINKNNEDEFDGVSKFNQDTENSTSSNTESNNTHLIISSPQTTLSFSTSTTVATKIISSPTTTNSSNLSGKTISVPIRDGSTTLSISNNMNVSKTDTLPVDKISSFDNTDQLTNKVYTTLVGNINKISSGTNILPAYNALDVSKSQQSGVSSLLFNNVPQNISDKGIIIGNISTKTFNFSADNTINSFKSDSTTNATFNNKLNEIVPESRSFKLPISDIKNSQFPTLPTQKRLTTAENSSKNDNVITFGTANINNNLPKEDTFTKLVSNNDQSIATEKSLGVGLPNNTKNKILPIQSTENAFSPTNIWKSSENSFLQSTQQNSNKSNSIISNNFTIGSNSKESLLCFGSNTTNNCFGNTQTADINKSFTFVEKKTIEAKFNGNSKTEINKSPIFAFGNNLNISNQNLIATKNNEDAAKMFTPFSFKQNDSENSSLKNSTIDKPFTFGFNSNNQNNATFNFPANIDKNPSTGTTAKSEIPNLFNPVTASGTNERLIRKATRRLHK